MGLSIKTSLWVSWLNGLVFFLCSAYPIFLLDRFGRPKPFMVASTVQSISMIMVAVLLSLNKHSTNYAAIGIVHESLLAKQRLTFFSLLLYLHCHLWYLLHGDALAVLTGAAASKATRQRYRSCNQLQLALHIRGK